MALAIRPPLMPIRRWMGQTARSMPPGALARRPARTRWETLSPRLPAPADRKAVRPGVRPPRGATVDCVMLNLHTGAADAGGNKNALNTSGGLRKPGRLWYASLLPTVTTPRAELKTTARRNGATNLIKAPV